MSFSMSVGICCCDIKIVYSLPCNTNIGFELFVYYLMLVGTVNGFILLFC